MGVFKWLRRDRLSLGSRRMNLAEENIPEGSNESVVDEPNHIGTIRTEEYKRSLAEFQARRFSVNKDAFTTPDNKPKRRSARHSLPISCTKCSNDLTDVSFNYEKTSLRNCKGTLKQNPPNIQFLFSNQQVFMPGNIFTHTSYMEQSKRSSTSSGQSKDSTLTKNQIDFDVDDETPESPPLYFKNNRLQFDVKNFIDKDDSIEELLNMRMGPERDVIDANKSPSKNSEVKLEDVMDELRNFDEWADEQLRMQSLCTSKSDDSKYEVSHYGLPVVTSSDVDIVDASPASWEKGNWGVVPVQVKKLNITLDQVRKKQNVEVNILRKFRHPNIILLMGLYTDISGSVHIICERCIATLHHILHVEGNILSVQTSVSYACDIASALLYLKMQGFLHTDINSAAIMVTANVVAKLTDVSACVGFSRAAKEYKPPFEYGLNYVGLEDGKPELAEGQPLLSPSSTHSSISKPYAGYVESSAFRWHAPELFTPDEDGMVHPSSKSDVYSLALVLWECCNAAIPWQTLSYQKLSELYTLWQTGIRLLQDGTYPGCLLELMKGALCVDRGDRIDLKDFSEGLHNVKGKISDMDDILIPVRLGQKRSGFSSNWDANSLSDLEYRSPAYKQSNNFNSDSSRQENTYADEGNYEESAEITKNKPLTVTYSILPEKEYSSQCSTPLVKKKVTLKDIGTPGEQLHKSDSTEYCSFMSPDCKEKTDKLNQSFVPKAYKSLKIKMPSVENMDIKNISEPRVNTSTYKFDIKDYTLPVTPIARNNTLRRNAWLSGGDINKAKNHELKIIEDNERTEKLSVKSAPLIGESDKDDTPDKAQSSSVHSPESATSEFEKYCSFKSPSNKHFFATSTLDRFHSQSWSVPEPAVKPRAPEEALSNVNVKPLVAIHEKWIMEANRKVEKCTSPCSFRHIGPSAKPASHSLNPLESFVPPSSRRPRTFRNTMSPASSYTSRRSSQSEQFVATRDKIARSMSFSLKDVDKHDAAWPAEQKKCVADAKTSPASSVYKEEIFQPKVSKSTNTSLDDFYKHLIKDEFERYVQNGNFVEKKTEDVDTKSDKVDLGRKSVSVLKINGNNRPLVHISFGKGENNVHVMDGRINVNVVREGSGTEKMEDNGSRDEARTSLKRCQGFNSIQEARSTEDLYIDDDIANMEEHFGDMKLMPIHDSLHEVLCEKADECCLLKVKQENGCDKMYFVCDDANKESTDVVDGNRSKSDTVIFKRSISVIEERIERVYPKESVIAKKSKMADEKNNNEDVINLEHLTSYHDSSSDESSKSQNEVDEFEELEKKVEEDLSSINTSSNINDSYKQNLQKISEENLSLNEDGMKYLSHDSGIFRAEIRETCSCEDLQ